MIRRDKLRDIAEDPEKRKFIWERRAAHMRVFSSDEGRDELLNMIATAGVLDPGTEGAETKSYVISMLEDIGLLDQDKIELALEYMLRLPPLLMAGKEPGEEE